MFLTNLHDDCLDFVIENKNERAAHTTEDVRECALEEGSSTFSLGNFTPAVDGVLIHTFVSRQTRLHHHTTTNSIKWIRDNTRAGGNSLSDQEGDHNRSVLGIWQHALSGIVEAEISGTVDDNT